MPVIKSKQFKKGGKATKNGKNGTERADTPFFQKNENPRTLLKSRMFETSQGIGAINEENENNNENENINKKEKVKFIFTHTKTKQIFVTLKNNV